MMDIREPLLGVTFEPRSESSWSKVHESRRASTGIDQVAVIWGANWVAKIDLDDVKAGLSLPGKSAPIRREADKKRARDAESSGTGLEIGKLDVRITRRYQPLMMFGFIGQELLAVERTWFDLAKELPEAWIRSGTFGS